MDLPLSFTRLTGQAAADAVLSPEYGDVYEEVHSDASYHDNPLFSRERFIERTVNQVKLPGFELISARHDAALVGFCFGWTMDAGRWWGGETTAPPDGVLHLPKLAVIELMVRESYRGVGAGRRLLGELLTGRAEPYATLLTRPWAPAHAMYLAWGWKVIGTCRPAPDGPLMDVLGLGLPGA
ncbi:GNAT family N-acetyltransferase [Nonomuraea ceibae]|uniref:GNAT family N-acetyltransferase n=1 Tax=Nonomuraea ceibae TaxID=1935170 RepID=UPI001C5E5C75|nr:GNAT family N-acetyltransferase [Nonomuraea ceibae]